MYLRVTADDPRLYEGAPVMLVSRRDPGVRSAPGQFLRWFAGGIADCPPGTAAAVRIAETDYPRKVEDICLLVDDGQAEGEE